MENRDVKEQYVFNKTKNVIRGIVAGLVNKIITLLLPFFVRTIFIKEIGIEYLGLNSLFVSVLQVLNLAELGISSAVVYSMYKPIADRDDVTICALLNYYKRAYRYIGLFILVAGVVVMPFFPYLINGTVPSDINLNIVYLFFLVNSSISYLFYGYKVSLLNAYQRVDVISNIASFIGIVYNITQIILLLLLPNYYYYICIIPIFTLISNLITSKIVDKMYPQYKCYGNVPAKILKDIKKKVVGLMIQKLCGMSRNTINNIFISAFISLSVVGIYNNYYMIFTAIIGILGLINTSMLGGIGNSVQTASVDDNLEIMRKFNCLFMCISTIISVCMFTLYQPFMRLWLGDEFLLDNSTVCLIVLYFFILKMGDIRTVWTDAVGLFWEMRWRAVAEASLNLLLNFILVQYYGINGVLIGTLISLFLINFVYNSSITFKYYFGMDKLMRYYLTQLGYLLIMSLSCIVIIYTCIFLEDIFSIQNLYALILLRLLCSIIISIFILYVTLHRSEDYQLALCWLISKIKNQKTNKK